MQNLTAERAFYADLFARNPENEHITAGYDELHNLALPTPPAGIVLDLGCGTGAHAIRLARRKCNVVAMDLTTEGVKAARERFRKENLPGRFVVGDAENLPFRDGMAEVTWTFLLLHHFPKLDKLPKELARITKRKVVALEPNAQNGLTWFANNVINRFVGISAMTTNQRAVWPGVLRDAFQKVGLKMGEVHYVDRQWADGAGWVRKTYRAVATPLGEKFRANKFLVTFEKATA